MTHSKKEVYKDEEEYFVLIEKATNQYGDKFAFVHLDVHKWNKTVLKKLQQDLDELLTLCKKRGYDLCGFYLENSQNTKFHEMLKPLDFLVKKGGHSYGGWFLED